MKKAFSEEGLTKNLSLYYLNRHLNKKPIERYHREIDNSSLHEREKYRKKLEILMLNSFMHHFPEVTFENLTCESPDFIAKFNEKTIGIELTEVINHLDLKKIESQINKIFREAEILLEQENTAKYRGVYFLVFHDISNSDLLEKQQEIVDNIRKSIQKQKPIGVVKDIRKSSHRRNVFITYDYNISLFDDLASHKIIEIINKKNEKYPFYDSSPDECWLVIISNMNSLASRYSFIEDKESLNDVKSPFNRIFHLENLFGSLTAIK